MRLARADRGHRPHRHLGAALSVLGFVVAALGAVLLFYAALGLPSNEHSGFSDAEGLIQFLLAGGVPVAGIVATLLSSGVRTGQVGLAAPFGALGVAAVMFVAWLAFFEMA